MEDGVLNVQRTSTVKLTQLAARTEQLPKPGSGQLNRVPGLSPEDNNVDPEEAEASNQQRQEMMSSQV